MAQKLLLFAAGVSFMAGVFLGYHLKGLRIKYLKNKRERLVKKLAVTQSELNQLSKVGNSSSPVIVVHGGAYAIPDDLRVANIDGVKRAAAKGYLILTSGSRSALDAVENAVRILEDDPIFNAGTGSSLNEDGDVEMDAFLMEGTGLRIGAVASMRNLTNPIRVARMVMEKTDHALLVGEGATRFALLNGLSEVDPSVLITEHAVKEWKENNKYTKSVSSLFQCQAKRQDTVGAVSIDCQGRVACATSTGGVATKMRGRVGDSPLAGCGGYCDDSIGTVSCTGHGESILKVCLARHITGLLQQGFGCQTSVTMALDFMKKRVNGFGGAIAINRDGDVGISFTTKRMAWSYVKDDTIHYGLEPDADNQERFV